jgi:hypothetical protein
MRTIAIPFYFTRISHSITYIYRKYGIPFTAGKL